MATQEAKLAALQELEALNLELYDYTDSDTEEDSSDDKEEKFNKR